MNGTNEVTTIDRWYMLQLKNPGLSAFHNPNEDCLQEWRRSIIDLLACDASSLYAFFPLAM
jgi:hypothetical protein